MITYIVDPASGITVPKLITVRISQKFEYLDMYTWLKENCMGKFYILPSYAGYGCQFEDDEDATMFALRWY